MQNAFASKGGKLDPGGPPEIQRATIFNVATFFGWVTTAREVAEALTPTPALTQGAGGTVLPAS
jgi:hypothetical protein